MLCVCYVDLNDSVHRYVTIQNQFPQQMSIFLYLVIFVFYHVLCLHFNHELHALVKTYAIVCFWHAKIKGSLLRALLT